jgi:tryptophan 2,3-dioxygenase
MTKTSVPMTYGDYLGLGPLLSSQHPISAHHDEMLFIIIHQTKELWLKQMIKELEVAREHLRRDELIPVHKILSRVSRIQAVMTLSWDVLSTMTPADYISFRSVLGSSSGFQSAQFRLVEYLLGLKDAAHLRYQPDGSELHRSLNAALSQPEPLGRSQCGDRPRRLLFASGRARTRLVAALSAAARSGGGLGLWSIESLNVGGPCISSRRS